MVFWSCNFLHSDNGLMVIQESNLIFIFMRCMLSLKGVSNLFSNGSAILFTYRQNKYGKKLTIMEFL